jgi:hypothetical protein
MDGFCHLTHLERLLSRSGLAAFRVSLAGVRVEGAVNEMEEMKVGWES